MLMRLALLPVLVGIACLLAAGYGALHNQISYTVAPSYFHDFKFLQFRIDPELHNRIGAAMVGVGASWWMGVVLSVPIYLAALFVRGTGAFVRSFLIAALMVVMITLAVGMGALVWAMFAIGPDSLPWWMDGRGVSDPVRFARAGHMHNFSYLGGGIGAMFGLIYATRAAIRSRRT